MFRTFFSKSPLTAAANPATSPLPGAVHVSSDELVRCRLVARDLSLGSRQPARSAITGVHGSRFRGRGMDYLESRGYQPGDDIRSMDWRVTARSGKAHVKLYQEERERPVVAMVDLGPGMFFATRGAFKSVIASRAAALLGWAAVQNGDRIGALLFNGGHHELRPLGGTRGVLRLIRQLVAASDPAQAHAGRAESGATGHLNEALLRMRRVARPGSLIIVLSDFYGIDADTGRHLRRLRQHNDVLACQVVDVIETEPPPPGRYPITDGRHTGLLDTLTPVRRKACRDFFERHHREVRELMQQSAIPLQRIGTTDDVARRLRQVLASPVADVSVLPGDAA